MLVDEIKKRMMAAMKAHDTVEKEILRTVLGETSMAAERANKPLSDEETMVIVRKIVKSNEETMGLATDVEQKKTLAREIEILNSMLPKSLSLDEIVAALASVRDPIRAAANDGQATGVAMKHLKASGAVIDGKTVTEAVKRVRA